MRKTSLIIICAVFLVIVNIMTVHAMSENNIEGSNNINTVVNNIIINNIIMENVIIDDEEDIIEDKASDEKIEDVKEDEAKAEENNEDDNNEKSNIEQSIEEEEVINEEKKQIESNSIGATDSSNKTETSSRENIETVTYNGSDNNYLSSLSISGYEFTKSFSKENTTYFVTVDHDLESIDIKQIAEDSNAKVCIYGNNNLIEGTNKILISVTAENGNVRIYRIILTRES